MSSNWEFYTQQNKQSGEWRENVFIFWHWGLKKFLFRTPFSRKLLQDMLHKNKGISQEWGRHGNEKKGRAKRSLRLKEENPDPLNNCIPWYTEGNQFIVACQKVPKSLLQEDETDRLLNMFRCINRQSDSATQSKYDQFSGATREPFWKHIFIIFYKSIYV